jgi:aspartate/methionine/tyrosine aminotransferase
MKIDTFVMERMQSTYENLVDYNLSESGVHPMILAELLDGPGSVDALLQQTLGYTQSNGTIPLRETIAALYPEASIDHIEVTNGGSEANYIATWNLVEPGDEVVCMVPNYMQTWGLSRAFGGLVREWPLRLVEEGRRWAPDVDRLEELVSRRTKLVIVCNPNNPTGARFTKAELRRICDVIATQSASNAWLLSDEIYRGAELDGQETPSVWGMYDRVIITSGLSKAYGLPGLRIGWIVAPPRLVASLWSYHDYTTIAPGALSDLLARIALEPRRRARILERTRTILRSNLPVIEDWLARSADQFSYAPPAAGAIIYVRYAHGINSTALVERLRTEKSLLIVPGDHFGMDGYLRINYGPPSEYLREGLSRLQEVLESLQPQATP